MIIFQCGNSDKIPAFSISYYIIIWPLPMLVFHLNLEEKQTNVFPSRLEISLPRADSFIMFTFHVLFATLLADILLAKSVSMARVTNDLAANGPFCSTKGAKDQNNRHPLSIRLPI